MSRKIFLLILTTLLFLFIITATVDENVSKAGVSSNHTITSSFDTGIGIADKNISIPTADDFASSIYHNNTSFPLDVSQTRLENSTRIISSFGERKIASQNAVDAALYIEDEMEKADLQVSLENYSAKVRTRDFNYWNVSGTNVVGIKEGNALKDEIILITAHYDSRIIVHPESGLRDILDSGIKKPYLWPFWSDTYVCESASGTGADDNAGGVACMLELARVLQNESFDRTIYFIAFSGEEYNLLGSQAWIDTHPELKDNIIAVINVDSVGNEPLCIDYLPQNSWLKAIFENEAKDLEIGIQCEIPDYSNFIHPLIGGDHEIFWENNIPAVVLFHQNYENQHNFHKLSDTIENIDFSVVRNASLLTAKSVIYLADPGENQAPFVNISDPEISGDPFALIYNVSDPESTVEVFFDNQSLGNIQSGRTFSLPEGKHTIKVLETDSYGNRGTDSTTVVNKKMQNSSFELPGQEVEYCGNYVIGNPENSVDSNRTLLYYYVDGFGPLSPANLLILTSGSHNLKICYEDENGTLFMENITSDFRKYSMDGIEISNPIADRKNPLVFLSYIFVILAIVVFFGKRMKKRLLNLKGSEVKKK